MAIECRTIPRYVRDSLIGGLLAIALCNSAFGADLARCEGVVKFERTTFLSMDHLGWLANPISASSSLGGVAFWPFDEESYPTRGEWAGVGVALANTGDIGAKSIGGVVWVKKLLSFIQN